MTDPSKERSDKILAEFKSKILQQMNDSLVQGSAAMFESQPYLESKVKKGRTGQPSKIGLRSIDLDYDDASRASMAGYGLPRCNSEGKESVLAARDNLRTEASPAMVNKEQKWLTMESQGSAGTNFKHMLTATKKDYEAQGQNKLTYQVHPDNRMTLWNMIE